MSSCAVLNQSASPVRRALTFTIIRLVSAPSQNRHLNSMEAERMFWGCEHCRHVENLYCVDIAVGPALEFGTRVATILWSCAGTQRQWQKLLRELERAFFVCSGCMWACQEGATAVVDPYNTVLGFFSQKLSTQM